MPENVSSARPPRRAPLAAADLSAFAAALEAAGLPTDDLSAPGRLFFRIEDKGTVLGHGGLELHGALALLRSVLVATADRGRGHGRRVVAALEAEAAARGAVELYLLTTTAAGLFRHLGYRDVDRAEVPAAIRSTAQYAGLCPTSAPVLARRLAP